MRQQEADQLAIKAQRKVMLFGKWMWFCFLPVLAVVLFITFTRAYHPSAHKAATPFSCAEVSDETAALGDGSYIAPVCGNTAGPADPDPDSGLGADYNAYGQ